jgi:ketosteroid isomerase-like protein
MSVATKAPRKRKVDQDLILEIAAAFNSRDADRIMSYFADDCTFFMASGPDPDGRAIHGKAAVHKVLSDRFKIITDMRWDHKYEYVCGNRAVSVWTVKGTSKDGTVLNYQGCDLWEFDENGLVFNKDTYWKIVRPD